MEACCCSTWRMRSGVVLVKHPETFQEKMLLKWQLMSLRNPNIHLRISVTLTDMQVAHGEKPFSVISFPTQRSDRQVCVEFVFWFEWAVIERRCLIQI